MSNTAGVIAILVAAGLLMAQDAPATLAGADVQQHNMK
jgi:hypothetical protein